MSAGGKWAIFLRSNGHTVNWAETMAAAVNWAMSQPNPFAYAYRYDPHPLDPGTVHYLLDQDEEYQAWSKEEYERQQDEFYGIKGPQERPEEDTNGN